MKDEFERCDMVKTKISTAFIDDDDEEKNSESDFFDDMEKHISRNDKSAMVFDDSDDSIDRFDQILQKCINEDLLKDYIVENYEYVWDSLFIEAGNPSDVRELRERSCKKERERISKKMIKDSLPENLISKYTSLSLDEVEELEMNL